MWRDVSCRFRTRKTYFCDRRHIAIEHAPVILVHRYEIRSFQECNMLNYVWNVVVLAAVQGCDSSSPLPKAQVSQSKPQIEATHVGVAGDVGGGTCQHD